MLKLWVIKPLLARQPPYVIAGAAYVIAATHGPVIAAIAYVIAAAAYVIAGIGPQSISATHDPVIAGADPQSILIDFSVHKQKKRLSPNILSFPHLITVIPASHHCHSRISSLSFPRRRESLMNVTLRSPPTRE
jgi:hypothetical protein